MRSCMTRGHKTAVVGIVNNGNLKEYIYIYIIEKNIERQDKKKDVPIELKCFEDYAKRHLSYTNTTRIESRQ